MAARKKGKRKPTAKSGNNPVTAQPTTEANAKSAEEAPTTEQPTTEIDAKPVVDVPASKDEATPAKEASDPRADPEPLAEGTKRQQIERLLDEGYTPVQIEKELGYAHTTVRDVVKKKLASTGNNKSGMPTMPMVLKAGAGQEVISPEAILQGFLLSDGDAGAWMLKGFMLYRAAQLAVMTDVEIMKGQAEAQAKAMKPILDVMEQARKDMDAAAQRAKDSSLEVATRAAAEVGGQAIGWMDEKFNQMQSQKPDIAQTPDPMKGLMARTMETLISRITSQMFDGQAGTAPGLVDKRNQGGE